MYFSTEIKNSKETAVNRSAILYTLNLFQSESSGDTVFVYGLILRSIPAKPCLSRSKCDFRSHCQLYSHSL